LQLRSLFTQEKKMIFKVFIIISLFSVALIYSAAIEKRSIKVDCDSLLPESEDIYLDEFLKEYDTQHDYEERNKNEIACSHFLSRFFAFIDKYKEEDQQQNEFIFGKRAYRKKPNKSKFKY
jgi:hypothetical protein